MIPQIPGQRGLFWRSTLTLCVFLLTSDVAIARHHHHHHYHHHHYNVQPEMPKPPAVLGDPLSPFGVLQLRGKLN